MRHGDNGLTSRAAAIFRDCYKAIGEDVEDIGVISFIFHFQSGSKDASKAHHIYAAHASSIDYAPVNFRPGRAAHAIVLLVISRIDYYLFTGQ